MITATTAAPTQSPTAPSAHAPRPIAPRPRAPLFAAAAVLTFCLAATFAVWLWTRNHENKEPQAEFAAVSERYLRELKGQLASYQAVLRGAAGLHAATHQLSAADWRAYVLQLDLPRNYPGLRAVAYLRRVPSDDLASFLSRRRADNNTSFDIHPPGERADYVPVTYVEPLTFENRAALGLDHMGDSVRREALIHARDEADVALSAALTMAGDAIGRRGMLMELPVYRGGTAPSGRAARARELTGYVLVAFRMEGLMSQLSARYGELMSVRITDRTDAASPSVLFDTRSASPHASHGVATQADLHFGGRILQLAFDSEPAFDARLDHRRSSIVALGGGVVAFMLTLLVWHFGSGRSRALAYAREMTAELRDSKERFELVVRGTVDGIWDHDFTTGAVYLSRRIEEMLGYAAATLERTFSALVTLIHPADRVAARSAMRTHLVYHEPFDVELRVRKGDGRWGWFRLRGQAQWNQDGNPARMAGSFADITAEREAEQKAERTQAFLTRIVDNLPDPFVVKSRDLRIIVANHAYGRFLGLPLARIIGKRSAEILPAGRGVEVEKLDQAALDSGGSLMQPLDVTDGAGRVHHVIVKKAPCEGPDGEPAVLGLFMDMTAEREALARFESILENTPMVAVVGLDRKGVVLHWNRAGAWLYGHGADDVVGRPLQEFVTRENPAGPEFAIELERVWHSGLPLGPMERRVRLSSGRQLWIYTTLFPVFRHGAVAEVFCMDVDITERKQTQLRLEESERRFRLMSDSAPVMIWVADADQSCTYVNRTWCNFTGESCEQSNHERWLTFVHPDDGPLYRAHLDEAFERRQPFEFEFRMRRHDGAYRWVLDAGAPRLAVDGSFAGFVGTRADITDRRETEDTLRRKRDLLQDLVLEQTADLRLAKEAAERANEAKTKFLANMSHELRTPMHAVLGYARLGKERAMTAPPEKLKDFFARIHASGDRLLLLLNDLLDLSKMESAPMVLQARTHAVATLIEDARVEFEGMLASKRLQLSVDIDRAPTHVLADAERFAQVMRNLLLNAIKFTPDGRALHVRAAPGRLHGNRRDGGEDWREAVEIVVSDEGVGIPEAELEAVFDKFVQSSKTRSGAGGTGLGLAICREIVAAHRGEIFARNNAAGGADIVVRLPAAAPPEAARNQFLERASA